MGKHGGCYDCKGAHDEILISLNLGGPFPIALCVACRKRRKLVL